MALDKDACATEIISAIEALNPGLDAANKTILEPYWQAIMNAIFEHIKDNIEITTEVAGVQTGGSTVNGNSTVVE